MRHALLIVMLISMVIPLMPSASLAHKLGVYAYVEDGRLLAEGYYADGSPCRDCSLEAYDASTATLIMEGRTGPGGILPLDSAYLLKGTLSLRLVLKAPGGHMTEQTVAIDEALASTPEGREGIKEAQGPSALDIVIGISIIGLLAVVYSYVISRRKLL